MAKESSNGKGLSPFLCPVGSVAINPVLLPAGHLLFRVHRQQFAGDSFNGELQMHHQGTQLLTTPPVVGELLALADRMGIYLEE